MVLLRWPRHYRGIVAPLLLLLAAGWLPHHHADHDGELRHVDEAHGSHTGSSVESVRLPAGGRLGLPPAAIVAVALPSFVAPIRRGPAVERAIPSHLGHDPPHARGSRAPPLLLT